MRTSSRRHPRLLIGWRSRLVPRQRTDRPAPPFPDCAAVQEDLSARLDGEPPGLATSLITHHLGRCAVCRHFADAVVALGRHEQLQSSVTAPDDLHRLLAAELAASQRPWPTASILRVRSTAWWRGRARWLGAALPAVAIAVAIPAGALRNPPIVPSYVPTPCTAHLTTHVVVPVGATHH